MTEYIRSQWGWLKRATRRMGFAIMLVLTVTSTLNAVRLKFFQAELFFSYQSTTGPYQVVEDNGIKRPGKLVSTVTAGEAYGWVVDYCLEHGIGADVELKLVRLAQDGLPEQVVDSRVTHWSPDDHRCGPVFGNWRVPEGARPGSYEVRRRLVFTQGVTFRVYKDLDPVHLTVSAVAFPPSNGASSGGATHSVLRLFEHI